MRILITGATGFIGKNLIPKLIDDGHTVIACARNPASLKNQHARVHTLAVDFSEDCTPSVWIPRLNNIDIVINAVGIIKEQQNQTFHQVHTETPIALFKACECVGIQYVIQISALGADENALSDYHISKFKADQYLRNSSLNWTIILPSIIYGPGAKSMALFKAVAALPKIPLIDSGDQLIQPIHVNDVTQAITYLVNKPFNTNKNLEFVGPEPISLKNLYTQLRNSLGLSAPQFFTPIQFSFILTVILKTGLLQNTPISNESIGMLKRGNTGNPQAFVNEFGFTPQSIDRALEQHPANQADRWHAKLFFLGPLLRVTIALLWIFTGITSAFIFPIETSYKMLADIGMPTRFQPLMLYGAALVDVSLGIAMLLRIHLKTTVMIQIMIILAYTFIISVWLPHHWIHPFGAITKNLPLIIATYVMLILEKD